MVTEAQLSLQDLPFDGLALFVEQTDTKLHGLKDSRATLYSLGLYTPAPARKRFKPQQIIDQAVKPDQSPITRRAGPTIQLYLPVGLFPLPPG